MDALTVKLQTIDEKTMFSATARENPEIIIDYFPPIGTGNGYTSIIGIGKASTAFAEYKICFFKNILGFLFISVYHI